MTENKTNSDMIKVGFVPMISHPLGSCIQISDYNTLYHQYIIVHDENERLKNRIIDTDLKKLNIENEKLMNENKRLNEKNIDLYKENEILKERILILEKENKELKEIIKQQDIKIQNQDIRILTLEHKIKKIEDNKTKDKLQIGLNDFNILFGLETTENKELNEFMSELREGRNNNCHYIRTIRKPDSEGLIQYKLKLFKDKLIEYKQTGDEDIEYLDELLIILEQKITNKKYVLDIRDKIKADDWWTK